MRQIRGAVETAGGSEQSSADDAVAGVVYVSATVPGLSAVGGEFGRSDRWGRMVKRPALLAPDAELNAA